MIREYNNYIIESLKTVDSTNDLLKLKAAEGVNEYYVITADEQLAGKGRKGRSFFSKGNKCIYMSILLRPDLNINDSMLITTAAAVSVSRGIESVTGKNTGIKWVNDIFHDGKKICGILAEASLDTNVNARSNIEYIVLGIGINVFAFDNLPDELKNIAGSVYSLEESNGFSEAKMENIRGRIIEAILDSFRDIYVKLPNHDYMNEYRSRCFCIGKEVNYYEGGVHTGSVKVLDIDDEGRLIAERNGERIILDSGEVSIKI